MNITVPLLRWLTDTLYEEGEAQTSDYRKAVFLDAADALSDLLDEINGSRNDD